MKELGYIIMNNVLNHPPGINPFLTFVTSKMYYGIQVKTINKLSDMW